MFGLFKNKNKNKNKNNLDNVIVGFLRTRQSELLELLGIGILDKEYEDVMPSKDKIINDLLPLLDRQIIVDLRDTLLSISSNRIEEIVGEYASLLQLRISAAQILASQGTISSEEIQSPNTLARTLHEEIEALIARSKELDI